MNLEMSPLKENRKRKSKACLCDFWGCSTMSVWVFLIETLSMPHLEVSDSDCMLD